MFNLGMLYTVVGPSICNEPWEGENEKPLARKLQQKYGGVFIDELVCFLLFPVSYV